LPPKRQGRYEPCFVAVSPFGYSHTVAISTTMLRSMFRLGCPTCSNRILRFGGMQPPYCFRGATRYSPMTIGRIRADLRTVCLRPRPVHLHTSTWKRSSYRYTTLAVLLRPVARGLGGHPEIHRPVLVCQSIETDQLSRQGKATSSPGLRSTASPLRF